MQYLSFIRLINSDQFTTDIYKILQIIVVEHIIKIIKPYSTLIIESYKL